MSASSTRTIKLDGPTASEHKFCKNRNRKLVAGWSWPGVPLHGNPQTLGYIQLSLSGVLIFTTRINKFFKKPWRHVTSLKLCKSSQTLHQSPRVASTKPTPIDLITNEHSKRITLCDLAHGKTEGKLPNPWGHTRKSRTLLFPSFSWLTPETKQENFRFTQCSHFVQLYLEEKEKPIS